MVFTVAHPFIFRSALERHEFLGVLRSSVSMSLAESWALSEPGPGLARLEICKAGDLEIWRSGIPTNLQHENYQNGNPARNKYWQGPDN